MFARPWNEIPDGKVQSTPMEVKLRIGMQEKQTIDSNSVKFITFTVDPTKSLVQHETQYAQVEFLQIFAVWSSTRLKVIVCVNMLEHLFNRNAMINC